MAIRFILKAVGVFAMLAALVVVGYYGLTFIKDESERELLAALAGAPQQFSPGGSPGSR